MSAPTQTIDEAKVEAFANKLTEELGAALNVALGDIGDRLGLYRAMADGQPVSAAELAERTGTRERYVREWLNAQAAGGFVTYEPDEDRYTLPPEHAFILANEESPVFLAPHFEGAAAAIDGRGRIADAFRSGEGVGWHEHSEHLFCGTERGFAVTYKAQLIEAWLPALDGVVAKLEQGARVADIGCGHGAAPLLMAAAFPASTFVGFDYHEGSIETARERAAAAGLADRVGFEVASADEYAEGGFDLVCFFDALHDMGDPVGAACQARAALAEGGACMVVEPFAGDSIEENLNPVGRLYYGYSTLVCTPGSLNQPGQAGLGTQAGEAKLSEALRAGGFSEVRRVAETPFNLVLEARP
jgi:SAM-dependent methyltransferase